ncbi:hypothetical protein Tco_1171959 [Tanacetum coccineum]
MLVTSILLILVKSLKAIVPVTGLICEIKGALFSMSDEKAPGSDGFTADFFKKTWNVVGNDVTCAIREFFINGWFG